MRRQVSGTRGLPRVRWWALLLALASVGACKRASSEQAVAEPLVSVGAEDVTRARPQVLESGPLVSGTLQARRQATARAEVPGTVLALDVEQGQRVREGQVLGRLDEAGLGEQLQAASSAARAAQGALQVARSEVERHRPLLEEGIITRRDFERLRLARRQAEGQLADARARLALARKQVGRTRIVAPLGGVVSERHVSAGDAVQPGAPLFTVVDPSRLLLEASVPAEALGQLEPGTPVDFSVTGYRGRTFTGRIERLNPVVDPSTGQVRLYIEVPNEERSLVVGLSAEGRVAARRIEALAVPQEAVDRAGPSPTVHVVREGRVQEVPVTLGLRDEVERQVEVREGLRAGDVVLLGSARELAEGTRIQLPAGPRPPSEDEGVGGGGPPSEPQPAPTQR